MERQGKLLRIISKSDLWTNHMYALNHHNIAIFWTITQKIQVYFGL